MVHRTSKRDRPTSSYKDLICGTYENACDRGDARRVCPTTIHLPSDRMTPIRSRPLGCNKRSYKYIDIVPIETVVGVLINTTSWINVIDLNVTTYIPCWIHHGIEFFRTPFIELPWRLIDHGYVQAQDRLMWYVVPIGASKGVFYFVAPEAPTRPTCETSTREGIRHLCRDNEDEWGSFTPSITGELSIDGFIGRMLDQPAWLIYGALHQMIPAHLDTHSITQELISNRKQRLLRMRAIESDCDRLNGRQLPKNTLNRSEPVQT